MKNISTVLSVVAIALCGVLFYLHFSKDKPATKVMAVKDSNAGFKIAYFDIDSLQSHYEYYKDALEQMKKRESGVNAELQDLKAKFQRRIGELQQKGPSMSQSEGEAAQQEIGQMEQNYRKREASLQEQLQNQQVELMKDLRKEIEIYLTEFNKQRGYAYIFSYEPGLIMYYKDSMYDITNDLVSGLNSQYKSRKKE